MGRKINKKTVMVVDDESTLNDIVEVILKPEGYNVIKSESAADALKKLIKAKPDLVLIDFFMPKMDGVQLLEKIRANQKLKGLKCAFLTAGVFQETGLRWVKKLNALDYIKKPFGHKDLAARVNKMLKK